jgi:hypothetical protein
MPRDPRSIERFTAFAAGEEVPLVGQDGLDPAGFLRATRSGLLAVAYLGRETLHELPAERFAAYLEEEGLEAVAAWRALLDEEDNSGRERFSRSLKSLLCTGSTAPQRDLPLGMPLELVVDGDPCRLTAGREVVLRLLKTGQPLAGALVEAIPLASPHTSRHLRSGPDGRLLVSLTQSGAWLFAIVAMSRTSGDAEAEWQSMWGSLTLHVQSDAAPSPPAD